jgi:hypothetical protein
VVQGSLAEADRCLADYLRDRPLHFWALDLPDNKPYDGGVAVLAGLVYYDCGYGDQQRDAC